MSPTSYQAAPSRACEIEFYRDDFPCQAKTRKNPFFFKWLAFPGNDLPVIGRLRAALSGDMQRFDAAGQAG
ncbi:MAG: hypothetical protein LBJ37_01205 [Paucimonas sp.]|nr:hypothetical protein [Paucimonas sp.]